MGWFGGEEEDPWEARQRARREAYESQRRWMHIKAAGPSEHFSLGTAPYSTNMMSDLAADRLRCRACAPHAHGPHPWRAVQ